LQKSKKSLRNRKKRYVNVRKSDNQRLEGQLDEPLQVILGRAFQNGAERHDGRLAIMPVFVLCQLLAMEWNDSAWVTEWVSQEMAQQFKKGICNNFCFTGPPNEMMRIYRFSIIIVLRNSIIFWHKNNWGTDRSGPGIYVCMFIDHS